MIKFKKGKYKGGDKSKIGMFFSNEENDDNPNSLIGGKLPETDWWADFFEEVWILEIPQDLNSIRFFRSDEDSMMGIPCRTEVKHPDHEVFWGSRETYVFAELGGALEFMEALYDGKYKKEVYRYWRSIADEQLNILSILNQYRNLRDIVDDNDEAFYEAVVNLIEEMELDFDTAANTLKMTILGLYHSEQELDRLKRSN